MDVSGVIQRAAAIAYKERWLWPPALLFSVAFDLPSLLAQPFTPSAAQLFENQGQRLLWIATWLTENIPQFVGYTILISILLGALWSVATIGQGAMIDGVATIDSPSASALQASKAYWKRGRELLWPLVAIDLLIFLPIFLIILAILVIIIVVSVGLLLDITQSGTLTMTPLVGIGGALILPLVCAILPVSLISVLFRLIAFRMTALKGSGIRESVRQVRPFLRQHWVHCLVLGLITGVIYYTINGLILLGGNGIRFVAGLADSRVLGFTAEALIVTVSLFVSVLRNLFLSASWTIGVQALMSNDPVGSPQT
ncbi:MAG: hypothetical protein AAF902_03320 [Chloroflexota bacterium]